jgi:hypothetical protein
MMDNVIYTVSSHQCNDAPNAVWAIDLTVDPPKVRSFALNSGSAWGLGGSVIGSDGSVYVQTGDGPTRPVSSEWSNTLLSLSPRDLALKHYFVRERDSDANNLGDVVHVPSPVVFAYNNSELIVTPCSTAQLCLLDSTAPGGSDHSTVLYRTPPIVQAARNPATVVERGVWGSISSWQDMDGTRWIAVPALGPPHAEMKPPISNGAVSNGFIIAFKLREDGGKTKLEPAWISRDLASPLPPVVVNGVVFVVSAGEFTRQITKSSDDLTTIDEKPKGSTHATLYALDAKTGRELYSSRNLVSVPASLTGITVANGRVYFGGVDGSFYAFGKYMELVAESLTRKALRFWSAFFSSVSQENTGPHAAGYPGQRGGRPCRRSKRTTHSSRPVSFCRSVSVNPKPRLIWSKRAAKGGRIELRVRPFWLNCCWTGHFSN